MKYLEISNKGLLDVEALTLIGASTKVGDESKIGQFGSGNKYAIAYFLRNGHEVKIFSGLDEIVLSTEETTFRGKSFSVLLVDGMRTSITTEMGKDWKAWQAVREFYCNALDEGEHSLGLTNKIHAEDGITKIYVSMSDEIKEITDNFDRYFSENKKVFYEDGIGKILEKKTDEAKIYRRGVRCFDTRQSSVYDYDFKFLEINEDRLVENTWQLEEAIWRLISKCKDKKVIRNFMMNIKDGYIEHDLTYMSSIYFHETSEEFKEVIQELKLAPYEYSGQLKQSEIAKFKTIPNKVFQQLKPMLANDNLPEAYRIYREGEYVEIEPNEDQQDKLDKCFEFLKISDFHIPYIVKIGSFKNKDVLGYADGESIVISEVNMEKGVMEIVNTMIEEFIHIKYGVFDESRGFQTAIIDEFVSYMQKQTGAL